MRYVLPILFFFLLASFQVRHKPQAYTKLTDSVILKKPESFLALERLYDRYDKDTTVLNYLLLKSGRTNYAEGLAYSSALLGLYFQEKHHYRKAHEYLIRALKASDQSKAPDFRVFVLTRLAGLHLATDSLRTALFYNQDALAVTDSLDSFSPTVLKAKRDAEIQLGLIYDAVYRPEEARHYFNEAVDTEFLLEEPELLGRLYILMGQSYAQQDSIQMALKQYRKARIAAAQSQDANIQAEAGLKIAGIYLDTRRITDAGTILDALPDSLAGSPALRQLHRLTRGRYYIERADYSQARKFLDDARAYSKADPDLLAQTYLQLSKLEEAEGNYKRALAHFAAYENLQHALNRDRQARYIQNAVIPLNADSRKSELELLTERNELSELRLRRNQNTFLITGLLFALLTLILYIIYRQYQLRNERKVVALEQSMLRSQMNPHFLFNSLNSIKHYIINNEQKNAVHYLNKFSKLVRRILEASSARETSLSEELETATLYMGIENIRFSYEIDFNVTLDKDVDPDRIRIPSLILQPFLENALWHGLSSKKGEKKIDIAVKKSRPELIQIAITDNGVGRAASEKLRESRVLKRKSLGIDITKERLQNFAKDYQNTFSIQINDLVNDGSPCGTQVLLQIPTA